MASQSKYVHRNDFDKFRGETLDLFEKQNTNVKDIIRTIGRVVDSNNSLRREVTIQSKSFLILAFLIGLLSMIGAQAISGLHVLSDFIQNLYYQTTPDAKWHTLIVIPFTALVTLFVKIVYDKHRMKKEE